MYFNDKVRFKIYLSIFSEKTKQELSLDNLGYLPVLTSNTLKTGLKRERERERKMLHPIFKVCPFYQNL